MKSKLLLLALLLLQTCGNAAIVSRFSIQEEDGNIVFVEDGHNVGRIEKDIKPNVKKVSYKDKIYFMKDAKISKGVLELRDKIGSIVASHILNNIFKDKDGEKRYPFISLVFNPNSLTSDAEAFYILSEDLKGFISIAAIQPYKKIEVKANDLENLYIGMYLIGGGDPHMHNISYNSTNHYLGSVDLDVSFKEHTRYRTQLMHDVKTSLDFFKTYSDLAIKTVNCSNVFTNFLFATDSRFDQKIPWGGYYDKNVPLYQETLKMNGARLSESINILKATFPDTIKLRTFITNTVNDIKKDLKNIVNEKIQLDSSKGESIFNATGVYFNKDNAIYKKYKEDSLIKSIEFLFDKDEHYIEKICQFVENRYATLVCIFDNPNKIVQETCEKCLLASNVYDESTPEKEKEEL